MAETYESKVKSEMVDHLYRAILALETPEDCYRFFDDLCTVGEIQVMAQRWMVAPGLGAWAMGMTSTPVSRHQV